MLGTPSSILQLVFGGDDSKDERGWRQPEGGEKGRLSSSTGSRERKGPQGWPGCQRGSLLAMLLISDVRTLGGVTWASCCPRGRICLCTSASAFTLAGPQACPGPGLTDLGEEASGAGEVRTGCARAASSVRNSVWEVCALSESC